MQEKLKRLMVARSLTITELAEASGVKRAYVSHLVHGERKNPSRKIVTKLARALRVSPETLAPNLYE